MAYRLVHIMGDIFIFDIDGCIMPNIFSTVDKTKMDDETIIQSRIDRFTDISLFPEFVEFYRKNCTVSLAVYFITGRKRKDYGKITEFQLTPLKIHKDYKIKHFPDKKPHILKVYFHWKAKIIKSIMEKWFKDSIRFYIYDDLEDLFPIIFKEIPAVNNDYKCKLIQGQEDWIQNINIES